MKKSIVIIAVILSISLLIIPMGIAFADQAFKTMRSEFNSTNPSVYPLKDGFVVATHMNGPVNFEKKEFQLHGAKPNAKFYIYRSFSEVVHLGPPLNKTVPAGTPMYSGYFIETDEHGNGHINTPLAPDAANLLALNATGTVSLHITNKLYDGLLAKDGGSGGVVAYVTQEYETFFDWKWTEP